MTQDQDAAAVAKKLKPAQRDAVLRLGINFAPVPMTMPSRRGVIEHSGFVGIDGWQPTARLSPLGLAVRAHLQEEGGA